ncbi:MULTISPECIES: anti-sigma factor [Sphingobacterium]|uniref:anti-sigma factor n=1 Tax=Sphingobacterium TaxID=28453 RepID=UPI0013E4AD69|nr:MULTISPECIES: anti-sigma factor [Sphingobacterium]QIH34629.1 anti-sigma factor [Sphingobacterium sp. DR205]
MDIAAYISSGIIESYVLGLASEEEVSILNCIRKNNVEVEQAIAEAEKALEGLADIQAMAMPAALKQDIWNRLEAENLVLKDDQPDGLSTDEAISHDTVVQAPILNTEELPKRIVPARSYGWAIAASILFVLSVGANLFFYQQQKENKEMLVQANTTLDTQNATLAILQEKWSLVQNPAVKTIALKGVENKPDLHALVFWDQTSKAVYLSLEQMPAAPKGKQYQLWAMVDGQPVSAGVFPLNVKEAMASKMLDVSKAQAFAITLEDEGGKPVPTLTELCVMGSI